MNSRLNRSGSSMKTIFSVSILAAAVLLAMAGARAQSGAAQTMSGGGPPQGTAAAGTPVKLAPEVFKNIQVLKDLPADQLQPSMQFIAASLGVQCDFCHVRGADEKDDKQTKLAARHMMQMTMDINKNNFNGNRG